MTKTKDRSPGSSWSSVRCMAGPSSTCSKHRCSVSHARPASTKARQGHDTRPIDIERALKLDHAENPDRRDLQRKAAAHIAVHSQIGCDELPVLAPTTLAIELHRSCDAGRGARDRPDRCTTTRYVTRRKRAGGTPRCAIAVGASRVAPPLRRDRPGPVRTRRALGGDHHWAPPPFMAHPFPDRDGRAARLLSHALLRRRGAGSPSWSVAHGLARHVYAYRAVLARADDPPQGSRTAGACCPTVGWPSSTGSSSPPASTRCGSCARCCRQKPWAPGCGSS